jgi:glycosyltransferase involved in cell wall biosynthesis
VVKKLAVAVPGDLSTATGGFGYDRRIVAELMSIGWNVEVLDLGNGFPRPTAQLRSDAARLLAALPHGLRVVVDGLALGALPEIAQALRDTHRLIALVHHPLALETGLSADESTALRASEQAALACARHVVTTSTMTMRILAEDFQVPTERLSVVEPGTDRPVVVPRCRREVVALLAVGAVVPRKGYDVLVTALAKIAHLPWHLTIAGDLSRSPATVALLRTEIARSGLADRVVLHGVVAADELASLFAASDLFVLATRFEGYGMAFTEALAHGLPVVGTKIGALGHTVSADAGVLVPVDDADGLADALRYLIERPEERERLATRARAAVFPSWREQATRFATVLEELV